MASTPTELFDLLPVEIVPEQVRPQLKLLLSLSDDLLFLDDTNQLAVDRGTLLKFAGEDTLIPAALHDIVLVETSKHLGRRIKARTPTSRRLAWVQGPQYGLPIQPPSEAELRSAGIIEAVTVERLEAALRARYPAIPSFWTDTDPARLRDAVLHNFMVNQTVWDCLVHNLGWWAAILVIGSIVVFVALIAAIGWAAALAWAIVYSGFWTAYIIFQCIAMPSYSIF